MSTSLQRSRPNPVTPPACTSSHSLQVVKVRALAHSWYDAPAYDLGAHEQTLIAGWTARCCSNEPKRLAAPRQIRRWIIVCRVKFYSASVSPYNDDLLLGDEFWPRE